MSSKLMMSKYNLKAIKEDFKNKGIFYTPKELGLYLKQFLPDKIESIYDPTCGDGSLLELFEDEVVKYGQDINEHQVEVAKSKLKNFNGVVGDTLKEPAFKNMKFDYIIANPPFSISWEPDSEDERFSIAPAIPPPSRADYAFILHILYYLSDKGIAVVLCFPGILYRGNREAKIRKWLVDNNFIEKIVAIQGDKFVDTKISTIVMVLNKNKTTTDIQFIDDELNKEEIITLEQIKKNDYNLSVNLYVYEEIEKEPVDVVGVQQEARKKFINILKAELEFDRMVCQFEGWNHLEYIEQIEKVLKECKG